VSSLSHDLLDLPVHEAVGQIVRSYLDRAERAIGRLDRQADDEALHDFRVSVRRLRTTVQAYRPYLSPAVSPKLVRRIRDLVAHTGAGRDAEVQLSWLERRSPAASSVELPGIERLREELARRRDDGYAEAVGRAPRKFRKIRRRLETRLAALEATLQAAGVGGGLPFRAAAQHALTASGERLDVQLSRVHSLGEIEEAHRARIRAKRVRYLLEPIADEDQGAALIARLREFQDLTGELRDVHLMAAVVTALGDRAADEGTTDAYGPGLERLRAWLAEDEALLFSRLRAGWLGGRAEEFFAALDEVAARIGGAAAPDIEIERKYLLTGLPPGLEGSQVREIDQGYLPGTKLQERIRRLRSDGREWYARAVKVGSGIRRMELQEETARDVFEALWPLTEGRRVSKIRYRVADGDLLWEIDRFTDRDLVIAEVELPSEDVRPAVPAWLAPYVVREVTGEPAYLNVNLAR